MGTLKGENLIMSATQPMVLEALPLKGGLVIYDMPASNKERADLLSSGSELEVIARSGVDGLEIKEVILEIGQEVELRVFGVNIDDKEVDENSIKCSIRIPLGLDRFAYVRYGADRRVKSIAIELNNIIFYDVDVSDYDDLYGVVKRPRKDVLRSGAIGIYPRIKEFTKRVLTCIYTLHPEDRLSSFSLLLQGVNFSLSIPLTIEDNFELVTLGEGKEPFYEDIFSIGNLGRRALHRMADQGLTAKSAKRRQKPYPHIEFLKSNLATAEELFL